jgi:HlyD family secretion protein
MLLVISRWRAVALAVAMVGPASDAPAQGQTTPGTASPVARSEVRALAHLEPESGAIEIGARPGLRVEQVRVAEGQDVKAGELLAVLEGHEQRERQLALAEAQKAQVIHQRTVKRRTLVVERGLFDQTQKAKLDAASRIAFIVNQRFDENTKLYKTLGAALQGKDRLEADLRYIESEVQNIKAKLEKDMLEIAQRSVAPQRNLEDEELGDRHPDLDVLDRQIELARADVASAEVRAPVMGRVLAVSVHAGEMSPGPLLTMGDLRTMVARAEVFQTNVLDVAVGDTAEVLILGRTVAGEVTRVGAIVARNKIMSVDPADLADRRVLEVVVRLADPVLAARLVNMQVEVAIRKNATAGPLR